MSEPTIYNPSIYNAPTVYNTGANGGGGGGGSLPEGYVVIGNKVYRTVQVGTQLWLGDDLELYWDGLVTNVSSSSNDEMRAHPSFNGQYQNGQGLYYNWPAVKHIDNHRNELCPGWRIPSINDLNVLKNYINNDGKKLMYFQGNWFYSSTFTSDSNKTLMGIRASGYYDSAQTDSQEYFFWWTREPHTQTNRAWGFKMDTDGLIVQDYYWYRWEFKVRLIADT